MPLRSALTTSGTPSPLTSAITGEDRWVVPIGTDHAAGPKAGERAASLTTGLAAGFATGWAAWAADPAPSGTKTSSDAITREARRRVIATLMIDHRAAGLNT